MRIFKTKWFIRFARKQGIKDSKLIKAIEEIEEGLNDGFLSFEQLRRVKCLQVSIGGGRKVLHELSDELTSLILVRTSDGSGSRNTTRVERSHRELRSRFTDRLSSNNSD